MLLLHVTTVNSRSVLFPGISDDSFLCLLFQSLLQSRYHYYCYGQFMFTWPNFLQLFHVTPEPRISELNLLQICTNAMTGDNCIWLWCRKQSAMYD